MQWQTISRKFHHCVYTQSYCHLDMHKFVVLLCGMDINVCYVQVRDAVVILLNI